ncbi:hypothetical protein [Sorangium sp. So ce204]|uniref:hypothetical protein n=1 Tax=Sorangium sp. So ce204 TaxID=3133288 RepID=UPI003F6130ED
MDSPTGFDLDETAVGTRIVHTERFRFFAPWRWVMDPFLREWLARDVREEMGRLKTLIEAEHLVRPAQRASPMNDVKPTR